MFNDKQDLIEKFYDIFVKTQVARMNADYDTLNEYMTDELYSKYVGKIESLLEQKQRNIFSDFELIDAKVADIKDNGQFIEYDVFMQIKLKDYTINEYGLVVKHDKDIIYLNEYHLCFIIEKNNIDIIRLSKREMTNSNKIK